ncbi:MAG: crosslink repair DNA glycosylase YcaQ family protein [Pseudomonadota bacterium]
MDLLRIDNRTARRIFIDRHALADPPTPKQSRGDLLTLIERLGFVQLDSIQVVERAHHMILFARNQTYRKTHLGALLEKDRSLFENWTHDASIIPTRFFPQWRAVFRNKGPLLAKRWQGYGREGFLEQAETVLAEIGRRGPCKTAELGQDEARSSGGWWEWNPSKTALEYLWHTGDLCVCHRQNFHKVYDLTENVIPAEHRSHVPDRGALIDWSCREAMARLGFATPGDLAKFWGLITPAEAKVWAARQNALIEVEITGADGSKPRKHLAHPDLLAEEPPAPPGRVRILSPFDPMIRDRKRAKRLFNFDYTIEVFVPEAKRKYGYYVFPIMEGDAIIGRIDMKADRAEDALIVKALWLENRVKLSQARLTRLEAELERQRRFAGVAQTRFTDGWVRT